MKISARNALPGTVLHIEKGAVNAQVTLGIAPGVNIVSISTMDSLANPGLKEGQKAFAVIKASSVMVGVD